MSHLIEQQITEIKKFIQEQIVLQKDILTLDEAAVYLGISKSYLYKLSSSRKITHYKPGNKMIYFEKTELKRWMMTNRVSTVSEIIDSCFQRSELVK